MSNYYLEKLTLITRLSASNSASNLATSSIAATGTVLSHRDETAAGAAEGAGKAWDNKTIVVIAKSEDRAKSENRVNSELSN